MLWQKGFLPNLFSCQYIQGHGRNIDRWQGLTG